MLMAKTEQERKILQQIMVATHKKDGTRAGAARDKWALRVAEMHYRKGEWSVIEEESE